MNSDYKDALFVCNLYVKKKLFTLQKNYSLIMLENTKYLIKLKYFMVKKQNLKNLN